MATEPLTRGEATGEGRGGKKRYQVLAAGRRDAAEVTVFDSVGFALEDFSALRFMHQRALALGLGEYISLIPPLADPKNLFGTLAGASGKITASSSPP